MTRRLNILTWPVHGSYFNALAALEHDWYLPVKPGSPEGYGGRGGPRSTLPEYVREVPADAVCALNLDLVLYQTAKNWLEDGPALLGDRRHELPRVFVEHDTPRSHATDTPHPVDDPETLLVHVTNYNRLMWNNNRTPTVVVEHSVSMPTSVEYVGRLDRGVTVVNEMKRRGRIAGLDLFLAARERVPLDLAGMKSDELGGAVGDIHYLDLHAVVAEYRFLYSPMRYTSLPLAVIEAMTMGMPVVAFATTELPNVIRDGENGYISCDPDELVERMQSLIADPAEARRLGAAARATARERFGLDRFIRDWNRAFEAAMDLRAAAGSSAAYPRRAT